ncbi:MAG: prolipoprotein diacylglyceryl transferase [Candidatus Woesearchaeota archaeon]
MFILDPNPVAFSIFQFDIRWYGLFAAIMALVGYYLAPYLARKRFGDKREYIYQNAILISAISGIIGARIFHVILEWERYSGNIGGMMAVWTGGLSFHGGLLFGLLSLIIYARIVKIPFQQITDVIVIPFALALSIGRIGNIMNSEILGRACDSCLFSFTFAVDGVERYPVQAVSMLKNLAVAFISYTLLMRTKTAGFSSAAFLLSYSVFRFFVEFIRNEPYVFWYISLGQIVTLPIIIVSAVWLWRLIRLENAK